MGSAVPVRGELCTTIGTVTVSTVRRQFDEGTAWLSYIIDAYGSHSLSGRVVVARAQRHSHDQATFLVAAPSSVRRRVTSP